MTEKVTQSEIPKQPKGWNPITHPVRNTIIFILLLLLGISISLYIWGINPLFRNKVSTNNAYITGKTTIISPQVSGKVLKVFVKDFDEVEAGQVLVQIDESTYKTAYEKALALEQASEIAYLNADQEIATAKAQVNETKAKIKSAESTLNKAQQDYNRLTRLVGSHAVPKQDVDHAKNALDLANANLFEAKAAQEVAIANLKSSEINKKSLEAQWKSAIATRKDAEINWQRTKIVAPVAGKLSTIGVKEGANITAGSALMYLVPDDIWVIANFKETDMNEIGIGQKVDIYVDALDGKKFVGEVSDISPATGAEFSVVPNNHATGNFIKVIQRVPVKIIFKPEQEELNRLIPGLSVETKVYPK